MGQFAEIEVAMGEMFITANLANHPKAT